MVTSTSLLGLQNSLSLPSEESFFENRITNLSSTANHVLTGADFWQRTAESVQRLSERPGSIFLGVMQGIGVLSSVWSFASAFREGESGSRNFHLDAGEVGTLRNRVMTGFGLTGSLARFGGWVHTECFGAAGGELTTALLGGVGSGVGLIRSGARAFEVLDEMAEMNRLAQHGERLGIAPNDGFKNSVWIHILNYTANILFACFSVTGLMMLFFSSFILAPLSAICLFGSIIMTFASFLVKIGNSEEEQKMNLLKANDIEKNYVC